MRKSEAMQQPERMELTSMDVADDKREELKRCLADAFPEVFSESVINFDQLRRVLGESVEPGKERFGLNWPGKTECMRIIQQPSVATLKPNREASVNFDDTENLFIEGDNLEVLKLLQKSYFGKIKMIYIDPPFNTGKEFIYPDKYSETLDTYLAYTGQSDSEGRTFSTNTETTGRFHSRWLNMMYPRLYLARNLLSDEGYICVSIGEDELANLRGLLNEIFGEENLINCVSVLSKVAAGASGGGEDKRLKKNIEYVLVYAKSIDSMNDVSHMYSKRPLKLVVEEMREAGESWKYTSVLLSKGQRKFFKEIMDGEGNPIRIYKCSGIERTTINRVVRTEDLLEEEAYERYFDNIFSDTNAQTSIRTRVIGAVGNLAENELLEVEYSPRSGRDKGRKVTHNYISKTVRRVIWLSDVTERVDDTIMKKEKVGNLWQDFDYNNLGKEGGVPFPNGKKPIKLIKRCMEISKETDGIILDFFAGSGSTGHAVYSQNAEDGGTRRYIIVQLPEPISENDKSQTSVVDFCRYNSIPLNIAAVTVERLKRSGDSLSANGELFDRHEADQDRGFRSFKLTRSNFKIWDGDVRKVGTLSEQLSLHVRHIAEDSSPEGILYELLLKAGFPLTTKVEELELAGKAVSSVQGGALLICLEKEITSDLIDALAESEPLQVICLDESFKGNDKLKANAVQTFKARAQAEESAIVFRAV